jgi:hypothetical protein
MEQPELLVGDIQGTSVSRSLADGRWSHDR